MREVWRSDGPVKLFAAEAGEGPSVVFLHGGLASHKALLPLVPALLVRGDDDQHPAEVSELYAASLPDCTVLPAAGTDVARAIQDFLRWGDRDLRAIWTRPAGRRTAPRRHRRRGRSGGGGSARVSWASLPRRRPRPPLPR